jgi:hypothetical protein
MAKKEEESKAVAPASPTYIGKITMSTIGTNPTKAKALNQTVPVAIVYGDASGIAVVKHPARDENFVSITGNFEAISMESGEVFRSGVLYLPKGMHEQLVEAVKGREEGAEPIRFGLEINAFPAKNPIGYSYSAKAFVKQEGVDALSPLRTMALQLPVAKTLRLTHQP